MRKFLIGAAVAAGTLAAAGSASAASLLFNLDFYAAGFSGGSLGTVTVNESAANTLTFDFNLNDNVFFQIDGAEGSLNPAVWFDLAGKTADIPATITSPSGGAYPTGGQFSGLDYSDNAYRGGGGFMSGFDYALFVADTDNPKDYYGGINNLTFSITSAGLSLASLTPQSEDNGTTTKNVFLGADLRQCIGTAPCITGPVGATGVLTAVPEPATWAMMISGFFGAGLMIRRRRTAIA